MPLLICPHCHVEMKEIQTFDIKIDICTQCAGVWLDQGELLGLVKASIEYEKSKDPKEPSVLEVIKQACKG